MAYKLANCDGSLINYIGTGDKPSGDIGSRLYDTSDSSHQIFDGTTWKVYKDASLYTSV